MPLPQTYSEEQQFWETKFFNVFVDNLSSSLGSKEEGKKKKNSKNESFRFVWAFRSDYIDYIARLMSNCAVFIVLRELTIDVIFII